MELRDIGRTLAIAGAILVAFGALLYFSPKLPFRLGRLPGDIIHRGENSTFYFPITTSILVSVAFSFLLWLISNSAAEIFPSTSTGRFNLKPTTKFLATHKISAILSRPTASERQTEPKRK